PGLRKAEHRAVALALALGNAPAGLRDFEVRARDAEGVDGAGSGPVLHLVLAPAEDGKEGVVEETSLPGNGLGRDLVALLLGVVGEGVDIAIVGIEERHRLRAPADVVGRVLRLGRDFGVGRSAGQAEVLRVVDVFRSGIDVVRMTWIGRPIPGRVEEPDAGLARRLDDRADTVDVGARGGTATGEVVADVGDVVVRPEVSGEAVGDRTEASVVRGCGSGRSPIAAFGSF